MTCVEVDVARSKLNLTLVSSILKLVLPLLLLMYCDNFESGHILMKDI